jgi:hypothetical protein
LNGTSVILSPVGRLSGRPLSYQTKRAMSPIGTTRTSRHVRVESVFKGKAEVGLRGRRAAVDPNCDIGMDKQLVQLPDGVELKARFYWDHFPERVSADKLLGHVNLNQ